MEQNPRGEDEGKEDEGEEVERWSVGRLRGKEMLHNHLFQAFLPLHFSVSSTINHFTLHYQPAHLC